MVGWTKTGPPEAMRHDLMAVEGMQSLEDKRRLNGQVLRAVSCSELIVGKL